MRVRSRHREHGAWASNGNIAVYIFSALFVVWVAFQVWARYGGGPAPAGLDPMVMAALGVAVAGKSVERGEQEQAMKDNVRSQGQDVERLKNIAEEAHPEAVEQVDRDERERKASHD